tara:strand:- start:273 stop:452 length:180 start_codon:yes stop_codon:yes gene_type:complete
MTKLQELKAAQASAWNRLMGAESLPSKDWFDAFDEFEITRVAYTKATYEAELKKKETNT